MSLKYLLFVANEIDCVRRKKRLTDVADTEQLFRIIQLIKKGVSTILALPCSFTNYYQNPDETYTLAY